ncbi:MAG TPA: helix-turn-helix transcriptional regulator [Gemmatimonadaceae bacterium]|nr:helix-turn-helix transcriptional regulator [Gemmatimonadaceae bacterium]
MNTAHEFGALLRRWRERRRMTQLELALAAHSSARHVSCLETGRARPSREIIAKLATCLHVPLREQNTLMLAAGFAPGFGERSIEALDAARVAIDRVLRAHLPYPGFAVDRHWNVVLSNNALPRLYEGCAAELMQPGANAVRLTLHPLGLGPRILNYEEWRAHTVHLLREQIETRPDPVIEDLLAEVMVYPSVNGHGNGRGLDSSARLATPLRIASPYGSLSFLNTTTVFGTPNDVTLAELALEMLFPADAETVDVVKRMTEE